MSGSIDGQYPLVSIVIPVLNCETEVDGCIDALRRQGYPSDRIEIIVADNGSTDGTIAALERLKVRYVIRRERGRSLALNAGLAAASGSIICTTDISCRPDRDWVANIAACFNDPAVGCVAGDIDLIPSGSNLALRYQARNNYMSPMHAIERRKVPFLPFADGANASFRREVFERIGDFDESFFKGADVEICYRMLVLTDYKIAFCRDCLVSEAAEPDLRALFRQRFRMGMGSHLMRAKYPEFYTPRERANAGKRFYWRLRKRAENVKTMVAGIVKNDSARAEDVVVRALMSGYQQMGAWYGRWYLARQARRPARIDRDQLLRFLARPEPLADRIVVR